MSTRHSPSSRTHRGFTLVEVLATMTLMGIGLPVLMNGINVATHCADVARHRNEAAALAESQLTEIVATGEWENGSAMAGDFGADWPDYHWQANLGDWPQQPGLEQIDLHVTWRGRDGEREVVVTTLVYNGVNAGNGAAASTSSSTSGSGSGSKSGSGSGSKSGSGSSGSGGSGSSGSGSSGTGGSSK